MYPLELFHKNQVVETISEKHMEVILDCIYIYIYIYIYKNYSTDEAFTDIRF